MNPAAAPKAVSSCCRVESNMALWLHATPKKAIGLREFDEAYEKLS